MTVDEDSYQKGNFLALLIGQPGNFKETFGKYKIPCTGPYVYEGLYGAVGGVVFTIH